MKFFKKLPTISYNNSVSKNLLARARLSDETRDNASVFHPYTLQEHDRIDHVSDKYYDNSDYMWLIYMANDIVDPYHDMYLSDLDFNNYIIDKYGSVATAYQQISYWKNNWESDDSELDTSTFESLPSYAKKYYHPYINRNNDVVSYVRKKEDWTVDTNKILTTTVANVSGTFTQDEKVTQKYSNNEVSGTGVVITSNTTHLIVKDIIGGILPSNSSVVLSLSGQTSNASANVQTIADIQYSINTNEAVYWSPITAYDHETFKNAEKRSIVMIDKRLKGDVENKLKNLMNE